MILAIIAAAIILLDQIVKHLIRAGLKPGESLSVIPGFFRLTYVRNEGTAFSMFRNNHFVTIGLTLVLIIVCLVVLYHEWNKGSKRFAICITMVAAGGIANMIDRLSVGYVTDMFSCGNFAVFNVADIFVTCGCFAAIICLLLDGKEKPHE